MRMLPKAGVLVLAGSAFLATMLSISVRSLEARPQYHKAFVGEYATVADAAKEAKCGVCHVGEDKKKRNNYGEAYGKALGEKNSKDAEKLKGAFEKSAAEKSAVDGKTFGDLIKDGKLPASK